MKRRTFYKYVSKLPEAGYEPFICPISRDIRLKKGEYEYCPITAVHNYKTGNYCYESDYYTAAEELTLTEGDPHFGDIVAAADSRLDEIEDQSIRRVRKALLKRLGLST